MCHYLSLTLLLQSLLQISWVMFHECFQFMLVLFPLISFVKHKCYDGCRAWKNLIHASFRIPTWTCGLQKISHFDDKPNKGVDLLCVPNRTAHSAQMLLMIVVMHDKSKTKSPCRKIMTIAQYQTSWCMMGHMLCSIKCWRGIFPAAHCNCNVIMLLRFCSDIRQTKNKNKIMLLRSDLTSKLVSFSNFYFSILLVLTE